MNIRQEIEDLKSRMASIETTMQRNVSQDLDKASKQEIPDFADNWKVVFKNPYWKLYKVINGKLIWIHIGRNFSEDVARRIFRKLRSVIKNA